MRSKKCSLERSYARMVFRSNGHGSVPSVMYGMNVVPWNESEIEKLDVGQNRVARMALNAPRYAAVEALRGDMGWSTFRERYMKATLRYKVRLERMEDTRLARKVYLWSERNSRWMKGCMRTVDRSNMQILWTYGRSEGRQGEYEWRMRHDSGEGNELDVKVRKSDRPRRATCRPEQMQE